MFGFKYDTENKWHRLGRLLLIMAASLLTFVYVWWILAIIINTPAIPTPDLVWAAMIKLFNEGDIQTGLSMWDHMAASLKRFLGGFALAFGVAVPLGLLIGYSRFLDEFSRPVLEFLKPIAPIAWAPVFIFATTLTIGPILVVFVGIFFPLLYNTIFGVKKIEPSLTDAAKTLGAKERQVFYKVMLPCTTPYIMNGMRIGFGIGWMCIVAAEMIAPLGGGLGYFISLQSTLSNWPYVFVGLGVISVLGILTTGLVDYAYRLMAKRMGIE
ncbi:MAG: ABC transporter permease [Methanomassiliicoccaceae archaeon]|jgi:NitT/TauT family transport system permease protein|nr:ABC transporter permease [Methanomassiliicoccaceae archaeon]